MSSKTFFISSFVTILFLQLLALWPSFNLALFGDDWLVFWRAISHIGVYTPTNFNHLTYFLTPYGPQDLTMGFISSVFGYSALPYYIISFILRLIVAYLLLYVVFVLTSNRFSAFIAGTFFAVCVIGLDTTNWVFNMTTYIGMIFLLFFTLFYLQSRLAGKHLQIIYSLIFLFLAIITVPIRMHGALVVVLISEFLWIIGNRTKEALKFSVIRLILFFTIILIIKNVGTSFANPAETIDRLNVGFSTITELFAKNQYDVVLYPITIFGNMFIPEIHWQEIALFSSNLLKSIPRPFLQLSVVIYVVWMLVNYSLLKTKSNKNLKKEIIMFAIVGFVFTLIIWIFHNIDKINFSRSDYIGATLVGGYVFTTLFGLAILNRVKFKQMHLAIISFIWPLAFIIMPWLFYPYIIYPAPHRYMIISAIGIGLVWGILNLFKVNKKALLSIFLISLMIQLLTTNQYLNTLSQRRGRVISEKIWQSLDPRLPEFGGGDIKWVYFASDQTNGDIVYNNVFFGFPPRMAIKYHIMDTQKTPLTVTAYPETLSAVTDGKSLIAQGHKPIPISPSQVYAYLITGETPQTIKVTDITDSVREDLKRDILKYQQTLSH